ncbi:MAG: hypothetical protein PHV34_10850 [Verrucomicrobiae bacterium]|nr:hypothetical protein [Verrucomicrobiae bacterium]
MKSAETIWWLSLLPGVARLFGSVFAGIFIGALMETVPIPSRGRRLMHSFVRLSRLPPACGPAFIASFVSPRAGNTMLAAARENGAISRRAMILGALANSFPAAFVHLRSTAFILIPLLGLAGLGYVVFQILAGMSCALAAIGMAHWLPLPDQEKETPLAPPAVHRHSWGSVFRQAWRQAHRLLWRVSLITLPLFILISWLDHNRHLDQLAGLLPASLTSVLPPSALIVTAAHLTNVINAAGVASGFLRAGELSSTQVLLTFVIGYGLSIPIRAVRHTLPATIGIFSGRDGVWIATLTQIIRLLFTFFTATLLVLLIQAAS